MAYPKFEAPKWQTGRISALRQKFAAPQVGRLKRGMSSWMGMGYDPQSVQARRATIRGFGEGLGGIMSAAGQSALSQYGQEYGSQFEAAKLGFGARMEEERTSREEEEAGRRRKWQTEEREDVMWGGARPGEYAGGGGPRGPGGGFLGGSGLIRRPEKMKQGSFSRKEYLRARAGRAKGGPVHKSLYSVGEGGTPSKPKPELVVYKGGRMELVGKKGPEIRTFSKEGQVIPAGKTKKILKNKGLSIVSRKRGGPVKKLHTNIMNYLTATRFSPSGAGHMPMWQFMLQRQPQKLTGLLSYMQGKKVSLGGAPFDPTTKSRGPRPPTRDVRGTQRPSLEYKASLGRGR